MTYTVITDTEIQPGKPVKTSLIQRLRDNLLGAFAGDSGAPTMNRKAISAGGTGQDGLWNTPSGITGLGYFEPSSISFTAAGPLPGVVIARVDGDVLISDIITLDRVSIANAKRVAARMGAYVGAAGADNAATAGGTTAGAGANLGSAGDAVAAGVDVSGLRYPWYTFRPWVGGCGGGLPNIVGAPVGGLGGGSLILLVEGAVDLTGGTIRCNGDAGANEAGTTATGAGAGGSIIIVATGGVTGGTLEAKGGAAASGTIGYGGGGGYIGVISPTISGVTKTVTGGAGANGGTTGGNGFAEEVILSAEVIRGMMMRSI